MIGAFLADSRRKGANWKAWSNPEHWQVAGKKRKVAVSFIQTGRILATLLVLSFLTVSGCSRENSRQKEGADIKPSTQETVEAIQGIGKRPIDAAKKAQAIGQGRTEDIDKAMEKLDKQ